MTCLFWCCWTNVPPDSWWLIFTPLLLVVKKCRTLLAVLEDSNILLHLLLWTAEKCSARKWMTTVGNQILHWKEGKHSYCSPKRLPSVWPFAHQVSVVSMVMAAVSHLKFGLVKMSGEPSVYLLSPLFYLFLQEQQEFVWRAVSQQFLLLHWCTQRLGGGAHHLFAKWTLSWLPSAPLKTQMFPTLTGLMINQAFAAQNKVLGPSCSAFPVWSCHHGDVTPSGGGAENDKNNQSRLCFSKHVKH